MRRGTKLGKYRLERRIGTGSFAIVWKARDTVEQRDVALKIALPEFVKRFGRNAVEREARIAARLSHPNIVAIRNADWIDGEFVIATDLAERNLAQYAGARRSVSVGLQVVLGMAAGLAHAHRHGVMHRDLKPENIMIFRDRRAAIGDFGVAKFVQPKTRLFTDAGTLGYMAPEQAYGRPRLASDVFSIGLIAYEVLTGALPTWPFDWPFESYPRLKRRVPESVHKVLRKAIQVQVAQRYRDAREFHRALKRALDGVALDARKRAPARRRRSRPAQASPFEIETQLFARRFGRALELHHACYRCGGPISEAMRNCPWCGTRDNSFREVTRYPLVCPACERGVRPEWTSCPWCYAGRFQGNGRPPPADTRAERNCTKRGCEGQLRPFMRYCPLCKTPTRRPWSHPALPQRCARCRGPVSREFWHFCAWCGRREPRAGQPLALRR